MSRVDDLIAAGFKQTSRKYRSLARLPPGKTGLEALAACDPKLAQHFLDNANRAAADQYLGCYATGPDKLTLTVEEFDEFLVKTGRKGPRDVPALIEEARRAVEFEERHNGPPVRALRPDLHGVR